MKQQNAFTLIEMLAVIAVIAVSALVIAPTIVNMQKKAEENKYNNYLEDLYLAAEAYVQANISDIPELSTVGGTYTVTIKTLREKKLIKQNLINPKTKQNTLDTDGIKITVEADFKHTYEYVADTPVNCFILDETKNTITDYTCEDRNIIIPSEINGITITSIGPSAFRNNELTSVEIPESVTSIGSSAFRNNRLKSIEIPSSVTNIGTYAFRDNELTSVKIPNSVTSIGGGSFNNNQLPDEKAFIYARNSNGVENKSIIVSYGGAKRNNIEIPSSVTSIGDAAFEGNQLINIEIPSGVTSIGDAAFEYNQLTSVKIASSVTSIKSWTFAYNQLTSIEIPSSVTSIGSSAFSNNPSGMKVKVNKANGSITGSPWGASSVEWTG